MFIHREYTIIRVAPIRVPKTHITKAQTRTLASSFAAKNVNLTARCKNSLCALQEVRRTSGENCSHKSSVCKSSYHELHMVESFFGILLF